MPSLTLSGHMLPGGDLEVFSYLKIRVIQQRVGNESNSSCLCAREMHTGDGDEGGGSKRKKAGPGPSQGCRALLCLAC